MFAVKRLFGRIRILPYKTYATNSKLVEVTHDESTGISILSMARPPVNSLNKELLNALKTSLMDVKKNHCKGVILASSIPDVFSAGIDIMEMYNRTEEQLTEFWQMLQDTWLTLYGLEIPITAAVNGACPAGGCLLAVSCEYRVFMEGKYSIGLNETKLGIAAPEWFRKVFINTIGHRKAELALLRGSMFHPKQALEIGLVDELATSKTDMIKKCEEYIKSFKNMPALGRSTTKLGLRRNDLDWLRKNKESDINEFLTLIQAPSVQVGLKLYVESLKKKR
ncbi:enoyl-CoA delta isomerase 1, mitochondrial [Colletes latitarsis]|uniref:enoyl-CoA delta isomerase 1, mitochondrial n=1 Tax=Colletes latitarsis TaxID=2605962 RepID=UPI00403726D9